MATVTEYFKNLILTFFSFTMITVMLVKIQQLTENTEILVAAILMTAAFYILANSIFITGDSLSEAIITLLSKNNDNTPHTILPR